MEEGKKMHVHFIAIGGAAMHNLAIALQSTGYKVTGSDDEIQEPSLGRLRAAGLLPEKEGWFPEKIQARPDMVILGMHARQDNPELIEAKKAGIKVVSFPEFFYEQSKNKTRVVIGGSHGKTTITSMILFVLKRAGKDFDYMVGAKVEGFDTMVRMSDAPLIILEGDEYLSSPIDRRPKFHLYRAEIALISGIAWDHINVFPTYDEYAEQFAIFADNVPANGRLIYCQLDPETVRIVNASGTHAKKIPYGLPEFRIENGITIVKIPRTNREVELQVFGEHNLMNLEGARKVCEELGVSATEFYDSISHFKGAARRLETLFRDEQIAVFRDFAHSPSKLKATTEAVRQQFPGKKLVACMELHTFSSLNEQFLDQYKGSMDAADIAIVYFNPHTVEHKKLEAISAEQVRKGFGNPNLVVITDSSELRKKLESIPSLNSVFLLMSSGNFDGLSLDELIRTWTGKPMVRA